MKVTLLNGMAHCPHCKQPVRRYQTETGEIVIASSVMENSVVSVGTDLRLTSAYPIHLCSEALIRPKGSRDE